jgi:hypothetical protein
MGQDPGGAQAVSPTRRRVAVVLLVAGAVVGVTCAIAGLVNAKNDLKIRATVHTPAQFHVTVPAGDWEVYEQTGTASGGSIGPFHYRQSSNEPLDMGPSDIRVEDPQGNVVPLESRFASNSFDTYATGSRIYTGVASFKTPAGGTYTVAVESPNADTVIVARTPLTALADSLPLIVGGVVGAAAFVTGFVLLILDLDRRRRAKARPQWPSQPGGPPLWGPPPRKTWTPPHPPSFPPRA